MNDDDTYFISYLQEAKTIITLTKQMKKQVNKVSRKCFRRSYPV